MYAIVLAGGVGSRLWPRSRNKTPKQLLDLVSDHTMIQETVARLQAIIPIQNITVVVGEHHAEQVKIQLPDLPTANILIEPSGKGTAPAIGLALLHIRRLALADGEKDPIIGSFHADHVITKVAQFHKVIEVAAQTAQQGYLVTLGIQPDQPHIGYGYIERGDQIDVKDGLPIYKVSRFVEKPDLETAKGYLASGNYSWNSGMFVWKLSTIQEEYRKHLPILATELNVIGAGYGQPNYDAQLSQIWQAIENQTIDVGIAEKSERIAVIPADIGWSDVGDWSVVADLIATRQGSSDGNAVIGEHIGLNTTNSLIYGINAGKLIATIGLDNLLIIDLPDVLLIAPRSENQTVKKIVERLKQESRDTLL